DGNTFHCQYDADTQTCNCPDCNSRANQYSAERCIETLCLDGVALGNYGARCEWIVNEIDGLKYCDCPDDFATTAKPTTAAPTTRAPTTRAPTTQAPTTRMPTTAAPTTRAPTTRAPTTQQPTTAVPTTGITRKYFIYLFVILFVLMF